MFTISDKEKVVSPERARPHSIMIFDDVICDKQTAIRDYFCMVRHKHIDSFYLSNLIIIFKQDEMNIKQDEMN